METRHFEIRRKLRYAVLGDSTREPAQVWFTLHGYGQLAPRFLGYFEPLDDGTRLIVAPEGLHRYYIDHEERRVGASWMTSEDRLTDIDDYVRYLDELYGHVIETAGAGAAEVIALGFSQGVHTLCRWIAFGSSRIDRAILWGAVVPPDLDLRAQGAALARTRLCLVVGDTDEYFGPDAVRAHESRLEAHGIPFTSLAYSGGHRLDADTLRRLAASP